VDQFEHSRDSADAIEGLAGPGFTEVAPLGQREAGATKPLGRAILGLPGSAAAAGPAQRPAHAFRRFRNYRLEPTRKRLIEQPLCLTLGQYAKQRIDRGLHRPLAEEVGTESVNRADVCLFEILHRRVEPAVDVACGGVTALVFEFLAKPELQLSCCLLREGDRHDLANVGTTLGEYTHDPLYEFSCLARAGGRLDNQRVIDGLENQSTRALVRGQDAVRLEKE
jgi:hypothetical protein